MKTKTYLVVCLAVSVVTALAVLSVPGLDDTIEQYVLAFLSTNAR
jgi:hypothetical protein